MMIEMDGGFGLLTSRSSQQRLPNSTGEWRARRSAAALRDGDPRHEAILKMRAALTEVVVEGRSPRVDHSCEDEPGARLARRSGTRHPSFRSRPELRVCHAESIVLLSRRTPSNTSTGVVRQVR